jgi:UDP-N-acetylmuramyl tripeptide synthase
MLFCKDILKYVSANVKVILVTGTNGKTTTCRIIETALENAGIKYFSNKSGANLLNGVVTSFCLASSLSGKNRHDYAVIECDEAALRQVTKYINPQVILVTNIFADQLDRYGDVNNILRLIADGINNCDSPICINADCSLCTHLMALTKNRTRLFGVDVKMPDTHINEQNDVLHCIKCENPYTYDYVTYAHLGGFRCDNCGYRRHKPDVGAVSVKNMDVTGSDIAMTVDGRLYDVRVNLPGAHNIYNALAASCALNAIGIADKHILTAVSTFKSGFGRMETVKINNVPVNIILVKNTAGFNRIIDYLFLVDDEYILCVILNDKPADGTDISWINDVVFEKLEEINDKIRYVYLGGSRAEDMALRLKNVDFDMNKVSVAKNDATLVKTALEHNIPIYITATYTAMFNLRNMLTKKYSLTEFYK